MSRNFIQLNNQGSLLFELPTKGVAGSLTGSIYNNNGSLLSTGSILTGSTDTILHSSCSSGDVSVQVNLSASPRKGFRFLIDGPEEGLGEMVTIKTFSVTSGSHQTLNLMRPLIYSHAISSSFQDTSVTVTIPSSCTQTVGQNYYVKLDYIASGSATPAESIVKSFDVARFVPVTTLSIEDLRDFDPQLGKKGLAGLNVNSLMKKAWELILARVGARGTMGGLVGSVDFSTPHSYLTRRMIAELDPEQKEYADMLAQRFNEEFEAVISVTPMDKNQDGSITPNEMIRNTIVWNRA